jgi:hypothetical protein
VQPAIIQGGAKTVGLKCNMVHSYLHVACLGQ